MRSALPRFRRRRKSQRCPHVKSIARLVVRGFTYKVEAARKDANDCVICVIEPDRASQYVGSASKELFPGRVAQDDHIIGAGVVFLGEEVTAKSHPNSK